VGSHIELNVSTLEVDVNEDVLYLQIQRAVSSKMEVNLKLEQDEMEGVDEREWVSVVLMNHNWEWVLMDASG
jgi:coronin-7